MANTKNGHQLIHLAAQKGLQNEMKERLLKAYFIEGHNVDDTQTLINLGKEVGLDETAVKKTLEEQEFSAYIEQDIAEARNIGVTGVPFFVFDRKYAVSGAQPEAAFLDILNKAFSEWFAKQELPHLEVLEGQSCGTDGNCD